MKKVLCLCVFWTAFFCAYGQQGWQENNDYHKVVLKTIYVPLNEGKGSVTVPLKFSKKEKQIVSELNRFLLKQQNNPNFPQHGHYNVMIRHYDNTQEVSHNPQSSQSHIHTSSYNLNPEHTNSIHELPYKQIPHSSVNSQLEYQHSPEVNQQAGYPLDSASQQSYRHSTEQSMQQGRSYTNAIAPQATQYQTNGNFQDNTKAPQEYQHSIRQDIVLNYPSTAQQNGAEYHSNPINYNTQPYTAVEPQTTIHHQPVQNSYQVEIQHQNPLPVATPSSIVKSPQSHITTPNTYQLGPQFQANHPAQQSRTFQSYQTTLSQQIQKNVHPEQSSQYQHTYPQNPQAAMISTPTKHSTMIPIAITQYPNTVHRPVEDTAYTSTDIGLPAPNPQNAQLYQNVYNSYIPRNIGPHAANDQYHSNQHTSSQFTTSVPQIHQQYQQPSAQHQSQVYQEPAPAQEEPPSQQYHNIPDPAQETYNANPRIVYAQPPSNYLYSDNQQPYTTNSNTHNVVVVYKNPPSAYQPLHYDQQSNTQKFVDESRQGQILPKVNFKPLYGYSYN